MGDCAGLNTFVTRNTIVRAGTGLTGSAYFLDNTIRDSTDGIVGGYQSVIENNRVYHNSGVGVYFTSNAVARNNRIYDNNIGVYTDLGYSGEVGNNIIYNNRSFAVYIAGTGYYGNTPIITRNTIIQPTGDAIRIVDGRGSNAQITNNIIQVAEGFVYNVDIDSNRGFTADYNLINMVGNGKLALWENTIFTDRYEWFYEVGQDKNSIFGDPQFVDVDGSDNVLGYNRGRGLIAQYFANGTLSGTPFLTRRDSTVNFNVASGTPIPGMPVDNFSIVGMVISIYRHRAVTPSTNTRMMDSGYTSMERVRQPLINGIMQTSPSAPIPQTLPRQAGCRYVWSIEKPPAVRCSMFSGQGQVSPDKISTVSSLMMYR